jgi:hypothetical protein
MKDYILIVLVFICAIFLGGVMGYEIALGKITQEILELKKNCK